MLKNLKRAASIALSFAMAIQFGLADSYRVNAVEEATDSTIVESANTNETVETSTPQEEASEPEAVTTENTQSDAVATPVEAETQSVELSYVAEDGTILKTAALRDFDLNHNLNTDTVYPLRRGNASTFPPKKTIARICSLTKSLYCDIT